MKRSILRGLGLFAIGVLSASACSSAAAPREAAPPAAASEAAPAPLTAKPEVSINAVMVALVDHAGHELWNAEVKAPTTDAGWLNIEEHAVQIAAAGPAITVGGTGPSDAAWVKSPSWQAHAQQMSDAGVAAMKAAQNKNLAALVAANGQLVGSCESCHKEFKPALPTEGILHTHVD